MIKEELRTEMRAKRRELTIKEVDCRSEIICNNLFTLENVNNAAVICTFLSAFKEPDTFRIIEKLWKKGCKVVVPITDMENVSLSLSYIDGMADLKKGAYGISEPSAIKEANAADIDLILVPGLAFDRNGGRMGFGKGYYDRLLESSNAIKIGICYDFQLLDNIPTEPHDIPMNIIVTDKEILEIR